MKKQILTLLVLCVAFLAHAQSPLKKVYDETIDPMQQIDQALYQAKISGKEKFVLCQVGGNWCPWCLRFADFASKDSVVAQVIEDNFVLIHVNYDPRKSKDGSADALMRRLGNPQRFGFPVFVVLGDDGRVLHTQDSSFLEEGKGYSQEKVLRFLNAWTPQSLKMETRE